MIHTDSGKYAIRALVYLAGRSDEELPVSAAAVAESEDIPPYYLAKVMQDLARAGLLRSVRGRGGGFTLKRPADKIGVLEILGTVENVTALGPALQHIAMLVVRDFNAHRLPSRKFDRAHALQHQFIAQERQHHSIGFVW